MQQKIKVCTTLLMICFAYVAVTTAFATTYKSLTIDEMLEKTEVAFQGKVTEVVVELRANQAGLEEPWTKVSFEVLTAFKGALSESHTLYFYGGVSEDKVLQVEAMPNFRVDEDVIIFAYDATYYSPLVGFSQGLFRSELQGWKSEASEWLGVEDDKLVLLDVAFADTEAVVKTLQEEFATQSSEQNPEQNPEQNSGQGGN